ncbi:hypothetical protein HNQ96_003961 [Aminobacter lissarensis]|uniref:Antitoxin Xre/MbcA/ParS-like middle domain-containing protein n=1 Tax=Aminobacter carboxidus TaxID=376165 RepID=A0A8E1WGH9_9HYPH|nr:antitoxin Xre/MbcA/ParS toxin-binding domain-containing protein [Aminobacter lissarensis]MBB6468077.1 hypothetical protein [Aminobacter lissarensis]
MVEDIHAHGINLVNKYTEFFFSELKNMFAVEGESTGWPARQPRSTGAVTRPPAAQPPSSISAELPDLASQFIRALAIEASRQCLANEGGDPGMLAQPSVLAMAPAQPRGGDLDSMTIEEWAGRVAGATYLEENLRIPRSTLHRWFRCNEVIALRKGRQRHVFPLAQFVDGRPASGIREVLAHIPHPRQAWHWMIHPSPMLNGRTPIELLKQDLVGDVVSAAKEHSLAS